ncbi:hypothetical protein BDV93DRAFT_3571 [Ceratobasidium sp. AG-I]|nr:hypothetical protein BDV93DRAFT_3571 [Ceratobasidium sp. AG-I]
MNSTMHLIFNSVSSLLQHWPNTIYRNGHSFVPAIIPSGTLVYHARDDYAPPPSPDYFAFDIDHAYLFCLGPPCLMLIYTARRDLHLGYFDGTSASVLEGPHDLRDILFRDGFVPPEKYDAWSHAKAMCAWAGGGDRAGWHREDRAVV